MDDRYQCVREAARRWLNNSRKPEYKRRKREALRLQWQISALKRKARQQGNFEAIALISIWEAEMLSHEARVKALSVENLVR